MSRTAESTLKTTLDVTDAAFIQRAPARHVGPLALLFLSLGAHGLLLVNDGIYWDDWLVYTHLIERDWDYIYSAFREAGLPQLGYFHWLVGGVSAPVFAYKLLAFVSLTGSSLIVYHLCKRHGRLTSVESFFAAALFLTYPAVQVYSALIVTPYAVCLFAFFLACLAALVEANTFLRMLLRIASLVLFAASFTIGSLIVFYFGFLALLLLLAWRRDELRRWASLWRWCIRHLDFILLPFLYWAASRMLFATEGQYEGYNEVAFSLYRFYDVGLEFLEAALVGQFVGAARLLFTSWVVIAICLLALGALYRRVAPHDLKQAIVGRGWAVLSAAAILLLGLAILPYAAVGKAPDVHGWQSRHALLISLPVGLGIVAAGKYVAGRWSIWGRRAAVVLLTVAVIAFSAATVSNHLSWQARWAKDRAVMMHLSAMPEAGEYSVYLIDDRFPAGGEDTYRYYEWASMFKSTWRGESRIGIELGPESDRYHRDSAFTYRPQWNLADFNPAGEHAILTIRRGALDMSDPQLALRYLWYRYVQPERLDAFLRFVAQVDVRPVASDYTPKIIHLENE